MSSVGVRGAEGGRVLLLDVDLDADDVEALGLTLPPGQTEASFVFELDQLRLADRYQRALTNKLRLTVLEHGAIVLRTAGARPLREELPPTVRERSQPPPSAGGT